MLIFFRLCALVETKYLIRENIARSLLFCVHRVFGDSERVHMHTPRSNLDKRTICEAGSCLCARGVKYMCFPRILVDIEYRKGKQQAVVLVWKFNRVLGFQSRASPPQPVSAASPFCQCAIDLH